MKDAFFRASVGAVIVNAERRVLACQRSDVAAEAWQLPQGGIKADEQPLAAVYREIAEETAIVADQLELLAVSAHWLSYELPAQYQSRKTGLGQTQKWHLFRYLGADADIKPNPEEFSSCCWHSAQALLEKVVSFRRPVYAQVLAEFATYLRES